MAIKTKEELLKALKDKIGDDTSDETLSLIEDFSDTLSDLETKTKDTTDWKTKFEENDKEWRKKYKDRFFEGTSGGNKDEPELNDDETDDDNDEPKSFDDLFKKGE